MTEPAEPADHVDTADLEAVPLDSLALLHDSAEVHGDLRKLNQLIERLAQAPFDQDTALELDTYLHGPGRRAALQAWVRLQTASTSLQAEAEAEVWASTTAQEQWGWAVDGSAEELGELGEELEGRTEQPAAERAGAGAGTGVGDDEHALSDGSATDGTRTRQQMARALLQQLMLAQSTFARAMPTSKTHLKAPAKSAGGTQTQPASGPLRWAVGGLAW